MSIADKLTQIAENTPKVYEAGKQAEYDRFWDAYQGNGSRANYIAAFARGGWTDVTYTPKYPIVGTTNGLRELFSNALIVDTKVPLILRGDGNLQATFNYCTQLQRIPSLVLEVPVTNASLAFNSCAALEEINIQCEGDGCFAVSIDLSKSHKLTKASIISIMNALSATTSGLSVTLSKTAVNNAFETGEGLLDGSTSDAWTALVNTCSNWTINLV